MVVFGLNAPSSVHAVEENSSPGLNENGGGFSARIGATCTAVGGGSTAGMPVRGSLIGTPFTNTSEL